MHARKLINAALGIVPPPCKNYSSAFHSNDISRPTVTLVIKVNLSLSGEIKLFYLVCLLTQKHNTRCALLNVDINFHHMEAVALSLLHIRKKLI